MEVNEQQYTIGTNYFKTVYAVPQGLHYNAIKVKYDTTLQELFKLTNYSSNDGLVFHYGFDKDIKCLSYMIGLGLKSGNNFNANHIPNLANENSDPGYYLVSDRFSKIEVISISKFNDLRKDYWCNLQRAGVNIRSIQNHALMVFHEKTELLAFNLEYEKTPNPHLYIDHAASNNRAHTPILRFGNDIGPLPIDNIDYTLNNPSGTKYTKKAFNIGQLCPPSCGTVVPPVPEC